MHKFLLEIWTNDENGNPKERDHFEYFDSEINLEYAYNSYRNQYQTAEVTDEETGETSTVTTGNRKYKLYVSECKYVSVTDVDALFSRVRG